MGSAGAARTLFKNDALEEKSAQKQRRTLVITAAEASYTRRNTFDYLRALPPFSP
jgi:hypothetical protein